MAETPEGTPRDGIEQRTSQQTLNRHQSVPLAMRNKELPELAELKNKVKELQMALTRKESEVAELRRFEHDSKAKSESLKSLQHRFDSLTVTLQTKKDELVKMKDQLLKATQELQYERQSSESKNSSLSSTGVAVLAMVETSTTTTTTTVESQTQPEPDVVVASQGSTLGSVVLGASLLVLGALGGAVVGMKVRHQ
jgi:predicted RNase H-like nuclease (RuvC/YqgF family)